MVRELKRDLESLMNDVEKYVIEEEKPQFVRALRYRLEIVESKYEKVENLLSKSTQSYCEQQIQFARAILY